MQSMSILDSIKNIFQKGKKNVQNNDKKVSKKASQENIKKEVIEPEQSPDLNIVQEKIGQNLKLIPFAHQHNKKMKSRGYYQDKYPMGAIVHFTAGRFKGGISKAIDTINGGIENGFNFLCISNDGKVVQACPLDQWGYHAGVSQWPNLGSSVSSKLVGIEINCAGNLTKKGNKYFTWYGEEIQESDVRYIPKDTPSQAKGYYHKYTMEQEAALVDLLVWLKANNPKVFKIEYILGHCEVAGVAGIGRWRKIDPSGSLSMSMPELRALVEKKYKDRYL